MNVRTFGSADLDVFFPEVSTGLSGFASLYHSAFNIDFSYPVWGGTNEDLMSTYPVPNLSPSILAEGGGAVQPRPGTMPGLYLYYANGHFYQYGTAIDAGANPQSTAEYTALSGFTGPVIYTNQISGAQLWEYSTYAEVKHVDGTVAHYEKFDPYASGQAPSGKSLWRVTWIRDPYDNAASFVYSSGGNAGFHRLERIDFPSGLHEYFNYAPSWGTDWPAGSKLQISYSQTSGSTTTNLDGLAWGLAFSGSASSTTASHFGSRLLRMYSPQRKVLKDQSSAGTPHTITSYASSTVTGQIVRSYAYYTGSPPKVIATQSVHTGTVFAYSLSATSGLADAEVEEITYGSDGKVCTFAIYPSVETETYTYTNSGVRTTDLPSGVSLTAIVRQDAIGAHERFEFDPVTGRVYSIIHTPSDDGAGRPRAHDSANTGIGSHATADIEPESITIYNIFDATCTCQKPIEVREIAKLGSSSYTRTSTFSYDSANKLMTSRTVANPATVGDLPLPATVTWQYAYVQAKSSSQAWGAWLLDHETDPNGTTTSYTYSYWLNRTNAADHGRIPGSVTRTVANVSLQTTLSGSPSTTTDITETTYRNLSNSPGNYAKTGNISGQPRFILDGDGIGTELSFREEGWLEWETTGSGATKTSFTYDAAGNVASVIRNATSSTLSSTITVTDQSAAGLVYTTSTSIGGVSHLQEFYYDRFGHNAVVRANNLDSNGSAPARHGGGSGARAWVEGQSIYVGNQLSETYEDRKPLDEAAGSGQFAKTEFHYLANGTLSYTVNSNGARTVYSIDGYGTLYQSIVKDPTLTSSVSSPKRFVNPFLEVVSSYERSGSDNLWTLITRNAAGAITQIQEPATTVPSGYGYVGASGGAYHQFEIDKLGRVVEARGYTGTPSTSTLATKREVRYDQIGRKNWLHDSVIGTGVSGDSYEALEYLTGKASLLGVRRRSGYGDQTYTYWGDGLTKQITDSIGNFVKYDYFANTPFVSLVTRSDLDPSGSSRVTQTEYVVDQVGRPLKVMEGVSSPLEYYYKYNTLGRVDRYTDSGGKIQTFLADAMGRVVEHARLGSSSDVILNSASFDDFGSYTSDGRTKVTRYDGLGHATVEHRDFAGRPFIVENPGSKTTPTASAKNQSMCLYAEYDEASRITAVYDGDGGKTAFYRDGQGRTIIRELAIAGAKIATWNTRDLLNRDALGRLIELNHFGSTSASTGGVPAQDLWVGDEKFQQDSLGRVSEERFRFGFKDTIVNFQSTNWVTNASSFSGGNPHRQGLVYDDNLSTTLTMSYAQDSMGRLTSIGWSGGASTLATYGWVGGLRKSRTVNNSSSVHTDTDYSYDTYGRLTQIHDNISSTLATDDSQFEYVYDEASNLLKEKYTKVDGSAGDRFAYDAYNRLSKAWMGVTQTTMNADPGPTGWVSGSMHEHLTYGLDAANNRSAVGSTTSSGTINTGYTLQNSAHAQGASNRYYTAGPTSQPVTLDYDSRGNLIFDGLFYYRYDFLNRLQEVWRIKPAVVQEDGEKYAVADESALTDSADQVKMTVPDLMQRLPRDHMDPAFRARLGAQLVGGVLRLIPNPGGGMFAMPITDADLELAAVYVYDSFNRRVTTVVVGVATTYHAWDGWRETGEYAPGFTPQLVSTPTKQFVWGSRLDELLSYRRKVGTTWENYFVIHGGQDTSAKLVNASGTVVEQYEYDPYGKASVYTWSGSAWVASGQSQYGLPFLWKSIRLDSETGLLYMRNRYYSTGMGRFLTRDPKGLWGDPGNVGNGMAYVGNNPMSSGDPLGLQGEMEWHHLLPQEFEELFRESGASINSAEFGSVMPALDHQALHNQGKWNDEWSAWHKKNPSPTLEEVRDQLARMKGDKRYATYFSHAEDAAHSYSQWRKLNPCERVLLYPKAAAQARKYALAAMRGFARVATLFGTAAVGITALAFCNSNDKWRDGVEIAGGAVGGAALSGLLGAAGGYYFGPPGAVVGQAGGAVIGGMLGGSVATDELDLLRDCDDVYEVVEMIKAQLRGGR